MAPICTSLLTLSDDILESVVAMLPDTVSRGLPYQECASKRSFHATMSTALVANTTNKTLCGLTLSQRAQNHWEHVAEVLKGLRLNTSARGKQIFAISLATCI